MVLQLSYVIFSSEFRAVHSAHSYQWVDWGPEGFSLWLAADAGLYVLPLSHSANSSSVVSFSYPAFKKFVGR